MQAEDCVDETKPGKFLVTFSIIKHKKYLYDIIQDWRSISRCSLKCTVTGVQPKQNIPLKRSLSVVPFRSVHRIPCIGYTFYQKIKKLKKEYHACTIDELIALRKKKVQIDTYQEKNILSVTGDTTHDVFRQQPHILQSSVLITEVTFFL